MANYSRKRKMTFTPYPKRRKTQAYKAYKQPKAEIKWSNFAFNSGLADYYNTVTDNINTAGERNGRIGNKIFVRNVHVQFGARSRTTLLGSFRVLLVQSKQGMLTGTNGSTDAPAWDGEANHDAYRVLYDKYHTFQYGDGEQSTIVDFKCKVNQEVRYKDVGGTSYNCDSPIYLWVKSETALVAADVYKGRYQIYWDDV